MTARVHRRSATPTLTRRRFLVAGGVAVAAPRWTSAQTPVADIARNIPRVRVSISRLPGEFDPSGTMHPDHQWLDTLALDAPNRWNAAGSVLSAITSPIRVWDEDEAFDLVVRPGALFHDGTPVLADDVRYTLERLRNGSGGRQHAWRLEHVRRLESVNETTLRVVLDRPDVSLAASLAHQAFGVLPAGADTLDVAGGSGPFMLDRRDDEGMRYLRNAHFWQLLRPRIDEIEVIAVEDDSQRSTTIARGEIDVLPNVPLLDIPMLREDPTVYLAGGPSNRVCHLQLNLASPALGDARVRRLLSRAIDRQRLVEVATAGQATPTGLLFPAASWSGGEVDDVVAGDPASIRDQLRLLGIPTDLRLRLLTNNADATLANTAIVLQEQLASSGIALSVDLLQDAELDEAIRRRDFDLLASYTEPWRDPHELVRPLLSSDGARNASGFADERVDLLIRGAILRRDRALRRDRYALIEERVQETVPLIVLFHPHSYDAVTTSLQGYTAFPPFSSRGLLTVQPTTPPA